MKPQPRKLLRVNAAYSYMIKFLSLFLEPQPGKLWRVNIAIVIPVIHLGVTTAIGNSGELILLMLNILFNS